MGSKVLAVCECGLKKEILIGGGMFTFTYECFFPCLCENCNDVVEVNLLENQYKKLTEDEVSSLKERGESTQIEIPLNERKYNCPKCNGTNVIPYTDSSLLGTLGDKNVVRWGDLTLTNGTYKSQNAIK